MTADTLIYAELLSNIRQISVIAVLPIPSNNQTTVALSSDRQQIALQHGGQTTTLTLPGQVHPTAQLQLPALGKTELSWRLPLAGQPTRSEAPDVEAPWPAQGLEADLEISCRECRAVFVGKGTVKTWKDLPSENWAEMMEFWHCHKPDDEPSGHEGHDHSHSHTHDPNTSKGYGANSKFIAKAGLGFVDIQTFLLAESDCRNYESALSTKTSNHQPISCSACHTYIGHLDPFASGLRLYKWRLQISSKTPPTISSIQIYTAQLSSVIQSQVTSRLILLPLDFAPSSSSQSTQHGSLPSSHTDKNTYLSLWILSPSIRFSSTTTTSPQNPKSTGGQAAMKIFYQHVSMAGAEELMKKEGIEEVYFPGEVIGEMGAELERSGLCLPASGRKFREWEVGLLERFEST